MAEQLTHDPNHNDPFFRILRDLPLGRETAADIWDACFESTSADNLKLHLQRFELPDDIENALITARKALEPTERDAVTNAIHELSKIPPQLLSVAEKHPNLLRHLIEAARRNRGTKYSDEPEPAVEGDDR